MSPAIHGAGPIHMEGEPPRHVLPGPDDDRTPMTRTELAMLWDLLRTWHAGHPNLAGAGPVALICGAIDAELAERFGG